MKNITKRISRKNLNLDSTLPLTISAQYGLVDQRKFFDKQIASKKLENYLLLKNGEFAYNKSYSKDYPFGAIKRLNNYKLGVLSTLYIAFKPVSINTDYLEEYFDSTKWYKEIYKRATEGARNHGLLNISPQDFFELNLSIPNNRIEQERISKILKLLSLLITLQQRKLKLLKLMKNIVSYNLVVSHKLASNNEIKWKAVYLKDIARIYQPTTITKKDLLPKGIPVFGANDYIGFYNKYNHETDQVTICARGASAGHPNYVKGPVWITGNSMVINVDETYINKKFLYTLLTFTDLKRFVTGGAQPQITRENLNSLKILLPSIKAQNNLSAIIENLSINIRKVQLSINSAKRLKQFLLQNMFI